MLSELSGLENSQEAVFTVSQLTQQIAELLDQAFPEVWVEGEISNLFRSRAGHLYFTLKDPLSQIKAVYFHGYQRIFSDVSLRDGVQVVACGKVRVYKQQGQYQLYVTMIRLKGTGHLQIAYEKLKQKLDAEGLFAQERKRSLPYVVFRVGVVTSLEGAAIRDILSVLQRRAPFVSVLIRPVPVQGEGASGQIARAIADINQYARQVSDTNPVDVIIVGRGGGSLEDLWAFNEEVVARAIYASSIPVISAVGHEVDYTIADFVADVRAPTPSAAAEMLVPTRQELLLRIAELRRSAYYMLCSSIEQRQQRIDSYLQRIYVLGRDYVSYKRNYLQVLLRRLELSSPLRDIDNKLSSFSGMQRMLNIAMQHRMEQAAARVLSLRRRLEALSPLAVLSRGFSVCFEPGSGRIVQRIKQVRPGMQLCTRLADGEFFSRVTQKEAVKE